MTRPAVPPGADLGRWDPEDAAFWKETGSRVVNRILWITTAALTLSFATWFMWSVIVVRLPELGWPSAIGAYGAFIVPMLFGWSLTWFASVEGALFILAAFYAADLVVCWWFYARKGAEHPC